MSSNNRAMNIRKASPDFVYKMIELIHDGKLMAIIRNPYKLLKSAGIEPGLKVLEIGCGPGAFTIPAAEIIGKDGYVYALDIHPLAVKRVKEKITEGGMKNIQPVLADASNTGLPDQEIDLVFMFGIPHVSGGLTNVLSEIHRVLKPGGILSFERLQRSENKTITDIENNGFLIAEKNGRILLFRRMKHERE